MAYRDLPYKAKRAVNVFYRDELGVDLGREQSFGYVELPMGALTKAIESTIKEFESFDDYHQWYIEWGKDISCHRSIWPVILDAADDEVILDGWHRFHEYFEKGVKFVPCILPMFAN